jgi:di/tricarboxylate transporter
MEQIFVSMVIVVPLAFVALNRLRADAAGLLIAVLLGLGQFAGLSVLGDTPGDAIKAVSGLGQPVIITLIALFILTECLEKYGVTRWIANRITTLGGRSEGRLIALFTLVAALLSLVMNNLAAGALLLPSGLEAARHSGVKPSKLLIPISYGTLLGGMATYFTTANIIVSGLLTTAHPPQPPLGVFDFGAVGGLMLLAGLLFLARFGARLLPDRPSPVMPDQIGGDELGRRYQLNERLWEIEVPRGSSAVGKTIAETGAVEPLGLAIVEVWRGRQTLIAPAPDLILQAEDELIVVGREERIGELEQHGLQISTGSEERLLHARGITLVEMLLIPRAEAEGKTLKALDFQQRYGYTPVALWRDNRSYRTDVTTMPLQRGDTLLVVGAENQLEALRKQNSFVILQAAQGSTALDPLRAAAVTGVFATAIVASVLGMPAYLAMLAGALLLWLTRLITPEEAYRAVEWQAIFLIAGMYSMSLAMLHTGLAEQIGSTIVVWAAPYGGLGLAAGCYLLTVALTHVMGGQVTALVTGPIAISAALQLGVNPQATAVVVAVACSSAFLTPIAHPVNILMITPGGYRFSDFLRVGVPLLGICFLVMLIGMKLFWGL